MVVTYEEFEKDPNAEMLKAARSLVGILKGVPDEDLPG